VWSDIGGGGERGVEMNIEHEHYSTVNEMGMDKFEGVHAIGTWIGSQCHRNSTSSALDAGTRPFFHFQGAQTKLLRVSRDSPAFAYPCNTATSSKDENSSQSM